MFAAASPPFIYTPLKFPLCVSNCLGLRGSIAFANLRQQIVERLQLAFDLKTMEVGFAFQVSFKSGLKKNERAVAHLQSFAHNFRFC
jgi:hypothetical protein